MAENPITSMTKWLVIQRMAVTVHICPPSILNCWAFAFKRLPSKTSCCGGSLFDQQLGYVCNIQQQITAKQWNKSAYTHICRVIACIHINTHMYIYSVSSEVLGSASHPWLSSALLRLEELGQLRRRVASAQGFGEVMVQVKVLQIPWVHLEGNVNRPCRIMQLGIFLGDLHFTKNEIGDWTLGLIHLIWLGYVGVLI